MTVRAVRRHDRSRQWLVAYDPYTDAEVARVELVRSANPRRPWDGATGAEVTIPEGSVIRLETEEGNHDEQGRMGHHGLAE